MNARASWQSTYQNISFLNNYECTLKMIRNNTHHTCFCCCDFLHTPYDGKTTSRHCHQTKFLKHCNTQFVAALPTILPDASVVIVCAFNFASIFRWPSCHTPDFSDLLQTRYPGDMTFNKGRKSKCFAE